MGSVWEAEHVRTGERVAVKLLPTHGERSSVRVRRFLREARTTSKIDHPNIVHVIELGEDAETKALFLVQELLRGKDLHLHLTDTPGRRLSPQEALTLLLPVMEALEAAHQLGVLHRDVKPSNIFLAEIAGVTVPKLIDFGLSKVLRDRPIASTTGDGLRIGTPQYMSPEQARGDATVDERADVWSLGVVLYECLAGRRPYDAPSLDALLKKIVSERARPIDEVVDVPTELATVVHRALEPDRDRRFGSMTELLHAVREMSFYATLPVVAAAGPTGVVSGTFRAAKPVAPQGARERAPEGARAGVTREPPVVIERLPWMPTHIEPAPRLELPVVSRRQEGRPRLGMVLHTPRATTAVAELAKALERRFRVVVGRTYPQIVDALAEGEIDLAWLPPVAYVRALRAGAARLALTLERDGRRSYSAALLVRSSDAPLGLSALVGKRATWVDPWSAAGYLVPRRMLRAAGIEPDRDLRIQSFAGSYEAVVDALLDGTADVGPSHCRIDEHGAVVGCAWGDDKRVRAIGVSSDPIPGDTICASATLSIEAARRIVAKFRAEAEKTEIRYLLLRVFGTDRFVAGNASRYEALESALAEDVEPPR